MALTYIVDPAVFAPTRNEVLAESDVFNYTVVMEAAGLLVHEVRPLLAEYTGVEGVWKTVDVLAAAVLKGLPRRLTALRTVECRLQNYAQLFSSASAPDTNTNLFPRTLGLTPSRRTI